MPPRTATGVWDARDPSCEQLLPPESPLPTAARPGPTGARVATRAGASRARSSLARAREEHDRGDRRRHGGGHHDFLAGRLRHERDPVRPPRDDVPARSREWIDGARRSDVRPPGRDAPRRRADPPRDRLGRAPARRHRRDHGPGTRAERSCDWPVLIIDASRSSCAACIRRLVSMGAASDRRVNERSVEHEGPRRRARRRASRALARRSPRDRRTGRR